MKATVSGSNLPKLFKESGDMIAILFAVSFAVSAYFVMNLETFNPSYLAVVCWFWGSLAGFSFTVLYYLAYGFMS